MTRVAVIDTGTNSTRLLVADVTDGRVAELVRQTAITRLGQNVDKTGHLDSEAKSRVRACVSGYAKAIGGHNVSTTVILATSSIREAADGRDFLSELAKSHSFGHRILSGDEEALLSFTGSTMQFDPEQKILFFDIGGGSTEIAAGRRGQAGYVRSLRIGCVRIRERFIQTDPVSEAELKQAARYIDGTLEAEIDLASTKNPDIVVAVAGTVTSLAAMDLQLESYDSGKIHGHVLTRQAVERLLKTLSRMSLTERNEIVTLESGRADVIVSGALIVSRLLKYAGISEFIVSERDILDGAAVRVAQGSL